MLKACSENKQGILHIGVKWLTGIIDKLYWLKRDLTFLSQKHDKIVQSAFDPTRKLRYEYGNVRSGFVT